MRPIVFITKMMGGGMETFCLALLKAWQQMGVNPVLYTSYAGGVTESEIPDGIERICPNRPVRKSVWFIAKVLRDRPDAPCLALSQEIGIVLRFLKKFNIIKNKIYFRESDDVPNHYGMWAKLLMRLFWPGLDGIIEQSRYGAEETRKICGSLPRCHIMRNIVAADATLGDAMFRVLESQKFLLACVASYKISKGQELLVRDMLSDVELDWHLTFWGEGVRRQATERLVETLNLKNRIFFRDWERIKDLIYQDVDCLVIPSDYEGLPNVMLEAILRGKRVSVRPTCVGARELLEEIGIGETWPWRRAMEIPQNDWIVARARLVKMCDPKTVAKGIADFMGIMVIHGEL